MAIKFDGKGPRDEKFEERADWAKNGNQSGQTADPTRTGPQLPSREDFELTIRGIAAILNHVKLAMKPWQRAHHFISEGKRRERYSEDGGAITAAKRKPGIQAVVARVQEALDDGMTPSPAYKHAHEKHNLRSSPDAVRKVFERAAAKKRSKTDKT